MVTILRNEDDSAKEIGRGLGAALGTGLGALASRKLEKMTHKEESNRLQSLGFSPTLANAFPKLPKRTQEEILSSVDWGRINSAHEQQQQRPQVQQQELQRMEQPQRQQIRQPQQQMQQPQGQPVPQQNVPRDIQQANRPSTEDILRSLSGKGPQQQPFAQQEQQFASARQQQPQNQLTPNQQIGQAAAAQQIAEKEAQAQGAFRPANYEQQQKLDQSKAIEDYKLLRKEQHEAKVNEAKRLEQSEKESKDWLQENNKKAKGVKEQIARLDKMEKLVQTGKLNLPGAVGILNALEHGILGYGVNLKGAFLSPESQEFEKLSHDMLSGIQDVFGSRILKTEVDNFLKTIPNLLQSDEGKLKVINNLKILNEAKLAQDKVAKDIVKENEGKIPFNLQLQVDERLSPILDELHNRFINEEAPKPKKSTYQKLFWEL